MPVRSIVALAVACASLVACGASEDALVYAPPESDFYAPPDPLPDGAPGDIIWVEPIPAPDDVVAWKVLYRSVGYDDEPIAVSGWVAFPDTTQPVPVISFAHGTTGLGDQCAPTRRGGQGPHNFLAALERGYAVAFTDYQGLGTPGLHHYLNGEVEANAVVHIAIAASNLGRAVGEEIGLWGFSQGGHAVLFAAEHFESLAPDRHLVGVAAIAPAVDISGWFAEDPPGQRHFLAMAAIAAVDAMQMEPRAVLSEALLERREDISEGCLMDATLAVNGLPDLFRADGPPQELRSFLVENDPGTAKLPAPLLLVNGLGDRLLTPDLSDAFAAMVCGTGTPLERIVVDASHLELPGETAADVVDWLDSMRMEGPIDDWCTDSG